MNIVLIVGASGTGKESLLRSTRSYYKHDPRFYFARRYATKPPGENEDNYFLDRAGFMILKTHGYFVAEWEENGYLYGIPWSFAEGADGATLFCSVSRTAIRSFEKRFDSVTTVQITARAKRIRERLEKQTQKNTTTIKRRVARAKELWHTQNLVLFDNSPPLSQATQSFINLLPILVKENTEYSFHKDGLTVNGP
jgi:ribose 1,5-bisphosphokinase